MHVELPDLLKSLLKLPFVWPHSPVRWKEIDGETWMWDPIRKIWVILTGEEYVRQQLVYHLLHIRNISPGLISIEKGIKYMGTQKRFDVVVFDRHANPLILCECKAADVKLSQDTLEQIARYNHVLKAPHLLVTNGISLLFFSIGKGNEYYFRPNGWYAS